MIPFIKLQEFLLICAIITETIGFDFCTIASCTKGEHTLCKYPNEDIACPGDGVKAGLTEELRKLVLDHHNALRQKVALGKQSGQPHASNMMKLTWHEEAEKIAQRWANQCVFQHDTCRNIENINVGQNIATHSLDLNRPDVPGTAVTMIDMWYDEVKDFDKNQVDKFEFSSNVGHYTQVVWAKTTAIGCGVLQTAPENNYYRKFNLVCNYVPGGNMIGEPLYKTGKACTECPEPTKCSKSYPGLCTSDKSDFGGIPKDESGGDIANSPKPSVFVFLFLLLWVLHCSYSITILNLCFSFFSILA